MTIHLTIRGVPNRVELRELAEARIAKVLARFDQRIHSVAVLLEDVTGPSKHAVDKRCRIDVRLKPAGEVLIDELSDNLEGSLALALDRLKAAISRVAGKGKRGVGAG